MVSYADNLDRYDLKSYQRAKFNEFFANMINGNIRVREYGPKAGGLSGAYGIYDDQPPHRPNYRSGRRRMGYIPGTPLRREAHDSDDWLGDEEEETKVHDGSCSQVHPTMSHGDWSSAGEEEEERHRLKGKYYEALRIAERRGEFPRWARP